MNHLVIDILFITIILLLYIFTYFKQIRQNKSYVKIFSVLSKNIDFLIEYNKTQEVIKLKNSIKLQSKFQIITKISKCDYLTYFKYDYSKRYIVLHFTLLMDSTGHIIQDNTIDKLPITGHLLTLDVLKSTNKDFDILLPSEINCKNNKLNKLIKKRDINKIYYQNIFKDTDKPIGIITISYKDKNFELVDDDKVEILRILNKMKNYL